MRPRVRTWWPLAAALSALTFGLAGSPARADVFGTISLLSASPFGQVEFAHDPAISEDGNYVVFDGSVEGVKGVWRRETRPGATLEQVAGGVAALPSVSANGRYVSFTTNEGKSLPAITDGQIQTGEAQSEAPSVYVRDMDIAPSQPGAFTLVSAKNHSEESLTYEFPGASPEELEVDESRYGATAAGRSAITADGRTVAFVTTAWSDLAGPATPPMQVAIRHLDTKETKLVSVRYDAATGKAAVNPSTGEPEPVPEEEGQYGAVWTKGRPPAFSAHDGEIVEPYTTPRLAGASISAEGNAVAWLGGQVEEQTRMLSGEQTGQFKRYAEPLWHRLDGEPLEATKRVTGGSEPENPACVASGETRLPSTPTSSDPCQGPFDTQDSAGLGLWNGAEETTDFIPRLSRNGDDVAFIATAPLVSNAGGFGLGGGSLNSDVYWASMTAPTKRSGLRQLTQFASAETGRVSTNADISDIGISPDGSQVAFTTMRTVFPLGEPAFISTPAAVPGLAELYDADLSNETLTRVTRAYEGGTPEHPEVERGDEDRYPHEGDGALSPSFDESGDLLAFSSTASNLVFGDGNTPPDGLTGVDGADAFLVPRVIFTPQPTPQVISPAPPNPEPVPPWRLVASASSLGNGALRIRAELPGAGELTLSASSPLPATSARRGARRTVKRVVAQAAKTSAAVSLPLQLELPLSGRYRSLASRTHGLTATLTITFTAAGHPTLRRTITVRFLRRHRTNKGKR
jgi:hypothetical protein